MPVYRAQPESQIKKKNHFPDKMKTLRLEILNEASRKNEMSLENWNIIHKLEKSDRLQSRKHMSISEQYFWGYASVHTPLCIKTIICERQNLLTEFDWRRAIIEKRKTSFSLAKQKKENHYISKWAKIK